MFINGLDISLTPRTKFLGALLALCLNWNNHVNLVTKRSMEIFGIVKKAFPLIHPPTHLTLYYSSFFSHSTLYRLLIIQKRFLKMVPLSGDFESSLPLFRKYLTWLFHKIIVFHSCLFTYKYINKNVSTISFAKFLCLFIWLWFGPNKIYPSAGWLACHKLGMTFRGPTFSNNLNLALRSISSSTAFKKSLQTYQSLHLSSFFFFLLCHCHKIKIHIGAGKT